MPECTYIHIPFCKSKCKYCSFISFDRIDVISDYIAALISEIKFYYAGETLKTLYFGGGTPSLLSVEYIAQIIQIFNLDKNCEITLELNPDDANPEYLQKLYNIGINRLSIGSQTFDDNILNLAGRRHSSKDIVQAIKLAKAVGFKNISIDLIYGLPTQDLLSLQYDLKMIESLDIQHVSTYGLKIEPESCWGRHHPLTLPNDDEQADMYEMISSELAKLDFCKYEISNFARGNFQSKHNLNYWNNQEYYGFGVSAHGYIKSKRYSNSISLDDYIKEPLQRAEEHIVTQKEKLEEEIFLGLRKSTGINISSINKKFGINFLQKYQQVLEKYSSYFIKTHNGYALNSAGMLISNLILVEFLEDN